MGSERREKEASCSLVVGRRGAGDMKSYRTCELRDERADE